MSTHPQLAQRNPFEPVIGPAHPSDAEAVLVGYGQSATGVGAGTRRTGDAVFAREEVGLPVYRFAPGATNQISCSGDSGGAALRGNVIGGVSHAGPGPCSTRDHSFYTAVAPYANWIAGTRDALESGTAGVSSWTNPASRYDVNANGHITAGDALLIINQLAREVSRTLARDVHGLPPSTHYWDVNGNGSISSSDALAVINQLARQGGSGPIGFDNSRAIFQPDAGTVASAAFRRDRAAIAAAYQDTAREVDAALGLHLRRSYFENWGGQGKKWVRGNTYWYFIEPDGFVYRYTLYSDGIAFGEIVAYLNDDYWRNPALLHDAQ